MPASASIDIQHAAQNAEPLTLAEQQHLLRIARASIEYGWECDRPLLPELTPLPAPLQNPGASFVTLERHQELRGCIGSLQAHRALAFDVAENAYAAAFCDPRMQPLRVSEWAQIDVSISVLSAPTLLPVLSEAELHQQLRPGIDGVILKQEGHRSTFLPQVWDHFEHDVAAFLRALRQKAGLPQSFDARAQYAIYQVQKIAADE